MVRTIRYSLGKVTDSEMDKHKKLAEFDTILFKELQDQQKILSINTIVIADEEFMVATVVDRRENRTYDPVELFILLLLIIITILLWGRL